MQASYRSFALPFCLALTVASTPGEAVAQMSGGGRGRHGDMQKPQDGSRNREPAASSSPFAAVARALEDTEFRLHLTPAQRLLWDRYARGVESLMDDQNRVPPQPVEGESAMKAVSRRVDLVRNRLAAMEQIEDAARRLYTQLSPDQQKIADGLMPATVPPLYSGLATEPGGRRGPGGAQGGPDDAEGGPGDRPAPPARR